MSRIGAQCLDLNVDHIAIFNDMRRRETAVEFIRPQGAIVSIDDTDLPMPMAGMKTKAASLLWELMFTRPMFETPAMVEQHKLLTYIAAEIDAGHLRTTVSDVLAPIICSLGSRPTNNKPDRRV